MKTKAKVCNFVTREWSAKKRSGNTILVFNMLKICDSMNEACANKSVGK